MKAKLELGMELDLLSPGELNDGLGGLGDRLIAERAYGLRHIRLPLLTGTVPAGGALTLGSQASVDQDLNPTRCGPRQGFYWRVTRISLYGMQNSDEVAVYFGEPSPQRFVGNLAVSGPEVDGSHFLLLKPDDYLTISGTSLTVGAVYTLNGEAIEAPAEQMYKLIGG